MKRALLIAGGTVGGLGAVLAITPPQLTSKSALPLPTTNTNPQPTATVTVTATPTSSTKTSLQAFTGTAVDVGYGIVQVKISVSNGKIIDAQAIQAPTGRNGQWTQRAVPILRQETIAANGSKINGVSGASYTSYGWYTSLVAALKKAGMQ